MSVALLRFLAMTVGPAFTAAARPAATFFAVQLVVATLVYYDLASLSPTFSWMVSIPAIVVAGVLAALELAARHDPDIAAILRDLQIDNATGAFGAFTAALLFAALGMPESEAAGLIEGGDMPGGGGLEPAGDTPGTDLSNQMNVPPVATSDDGILGATAAAASSNHSMGVQVGAVGGAVGINVGLTWLRSQLMEFVDDFDLGKLWARLETGGVIGVLVLLPLLPLVVFGFILLFALVLGGLAWTARKASQYMDERSRVPCESCDYELRQEASLCPECGAERTPDIESHTGIKEAWDALFRRQDEDKETAKPALE